MNFTWIFLKHFIVIFIKVTIVSQREKVTFTIAFLIINVRVCAENTILLSGYCNSDCFTLLFIVLFEFVSIKIIIIGLSKESQLIIIFETYKVNQFSLLISVENFRFKEDWNLLLLFLFLILLVLLNLVYDSYLEIWEKSLITLLGFFLLFILWEKAKLLFLGFLSFIIFTCFLSNFPQFLGLRDIKVNILVALMAVNSFMHRRWSHRDAAICAGYAHLVATWKIVWRLLTLTHFEITILTKLSGVVHLVWFWRIQ